MGLRWALAHGHAQGGYRDVNKAPVFLVLKITPLGATDCGALFEETGDRIKQDSRGDTVCRSLKTFSANSTKSRNGFQFSRWFPRKPTHNLSPEKVHTQFLGEGSGRVHQRYGHSAAHLPTPAHGPGMSERMPKLLAQSLFAVFFS